MQSIFTYAVALAVLSVLSLVAQQSRDATAQALQHTEWKEIPPEEIVVNLFDLKGMSVARASSRTWTDRVINQQFSFLRGFGYIQHAPVTIFERAGTASVREPDNLKNQIHRLLKVPERLLKYGETREIYAVNERAGLLLEFRVGVGGHWCIASDTAFLSDPGKYGNAADQFDTTVLLMDCSGQRSIGETTSWLKKVRIVSPEYNRGRTKQ